MIDAPLAWAEAVLGKDIVTCGRLAGGMTSTMLAIEDESGRRSVLRLMTEEPWRSHGERLPVRSASSTTTCSSG